MKQKTTRSHHLIRLSPCLLVSLLFATTGGLLRAQSITFEVRGHMTEPSGLDLQIGDSFVADYTFDPATPATGNIVSHQVHDNGACGWSWHSPAAGFGSSLELANAALPA